jgi:hypothetical protein
MYSCFFKATTRNMIHIQVIICAEVTDLVADGWGKSHQNLHDLPSLSRIIICVTRSRMIKVSGTCSTQGDDEIHIKFNWKILTVAVDYFKPSETEYSESISYPILPDFWKRIAFWNFPGFARLSCLEYHVVWSHGGKILTVGNARSSAKLSNINLMLIDRASNTVLFSSKTEYNWIVFNDSVRTAQ